ncbi:threonine synthase [Parasphaerochaeta coccoides]|uniref:Threonine synthase n=1 Tax=Parasphaerochaeta coccoides (strain ATCC BAA-1237 / DSM 17374 / SPN1) TaxID=760011 RepID=F4GIF0_PARC1|nr:threonine synthase [Parasphaerochaeta coccoides]AEC01658.1 threonine synthase [Parasphaerochaeta coccoides DSM 17374]
MKFFSTRKKAPHVNLGESLLTGLAPDGGLYVPETIPARDFREYFPSSFPALAADVLSPFFEKDPLASSLDDICASAFNFPVPLHSLGDDREVLELFHGPTAAFKDFGARFLARSMEKELVRSGRTLTILVATSGDTGGAVAAAFHGCRGINVKVLFPKGRVSARQKRQLTCWGDNISAYEVEGSFDDCQKMVKDAFMDKDVSRRERLSSANSINLGRLLPQMTYYVHSALEFKKKHGANPLVIVPSGNVGNSCAGYWAKTSGAPIARIALAVNANSTIVDFLSSGRYEPRPSVATLANAMDVGAPSNMERLQELFPSFKEFSANVTAWSVSDEHIRETIGKTWENDRYVMCPHTATAEYVRLTHFPREKSIIVSTAHPAKFETIVEPLVGHSVAVPDSLAVLLEKKETYQSIPADHHLLFA